MQSTERATKRAALLVAAMGSFLTPFMGSAINIALPSISREFAMNAVSLGWVATAYLLAAAIFLVPFGRISDIYGRKKIYTWGMLIYTLASLLLAMSPSSTMLIAFRALQGIGGSMIFGTGIAILISVFPMGERGRALGINLAVLYLALSLGPFLGGLLTQHFGWRSIFAVNVPLGLIVIATIFWKLKGEWAEARGENFDLTGSVIYSLVLIAVIYGLTLLPALSGAVAIGIGILGMLAFIKWETRIESPVLHMELFRNNAMFTFSNLAALIHYSASFAVTFLLSLYLQYNKGLSPQNAGLVLLAMPSIQICFSPFAGRLSDKIEPRILASVGMAVTTMGLIPFIFLEQNTTIPFVLASLAVLGIGHAVFSPPNTLAVMSCVHKKFLGVASATLATMRQIGMMFSMAIAMLIFAVIIGRVEISPQYYPVFITSLKIGFITFSALCFAGIFASLATGKIQTNSADVSK
ncbi:MFS transporter [Chloroflexota bacterium]